MELGFDAGWLSTAKKPKKQTPGPFFQKNPGGINKFKANTAQHKNTKSVTNNKKYNDIMHKQQ